MHSVTATKTDHPRFAPSAIRQSEIDEHMEVKKVVPPKVSYVEAVQARRHAGIFDPLMVQVGEHGYRVEVLSPKERVEKPAMMSVCLSEGEDRLWLTLSDWINPSLPGGELRKGQLAELPKPLLIGVVKTQLSCLFSLFPALPANVTRVVDGNGIPGDLWTLRLRISTGAQRPVIVSLRYPETLYPLIEQMLDRMRVNQPETWDVLPMRVSLLLGSCTVRVSDLNLFKKGDFLLLDRPNDYYNKAAMIALQQHKVAKVTLLDEAIRIEKIMNEENQLNVGSVVSGLDDIPMTLDFRLAQTELPLSELKRLGVGSIVSMNVPQKQLVTILCNGKKIGNGELVTVDSKVGVRINSLVIDNNG